MPEYCPECYIVKGERIELQTQQTSFGRDYLYCPECKSEIRLLTSPDETEENCPVCEMRTIHRAGICKVCQKNLYYKSSTAQGKTNNERK
jgi:hypothetical protein